MKMIIFNKSTEPDKWKYVGFNDTWLTIIGIPFVTLMLGALFLSESENSWVKFRRAWTTGIWYTGTYWLLTRYAVLKLRKRFNQFEDTGKRLVYIVIMILVFAPIIGITIGAIFTMLAQVTILDGFDLSPGKLGLLPAYVACFFMVAVYETIYFYHQLKNSIEEREQAKQAQIRSELAGLRNQVNPHFLFNSMNTLMNIVMEDQRLAVDFLKKLSTVYRYVLENREAQTIPLSQELDFIYSYVFLQKERFKGSLEVQFDIADRYLDQHIIPLSLQILFENAIKHNIISRKRPLLIEVAVLDGKLRIRNNLQRKEQVMDSTKVGLANIQTRYRFFTEESVQIIEDEQYFAVAIPLLVDG